MNKRLSLLSAIAATVFLSACGGGGSDSPSTPGGISAPPATTTSFTRSAAWTFALPASGTSLCYDVDTQSEVAGCTGTAWDLKITSSGSTATLWTNSGTSGTGKGGAFGGPFDHTWTELSTWLNGTTDPVNGAIPSTVFFADSASGVFSGTNDIGSAVYDTAWVERPTTCSIRTTASSSSPPTTPRRTRRAPRAPRCSSFRSPATTGGYGWHDLRLSVHPLGRHGRAKRGEGRPC